MFLDNYKFIDFTNDNDSYKNIDISKEFEIPIDNHCGAFGTQRKNHIHEGIDIYCENKTKLYSLTSGKIVDLGQFTGGSDSPWWNNTEYIAILHKDFIIVYGEISLNKSLKINDFIKAGDFIGNIEQVLKIDKGRPMSMLHLELYDANFYTGPKEWIKEKPIGLLNPINLLKKYFK